MLAGWCTRSPRYTAKNSKAQLYGGGGNYCGGGGAADNTVHTIVWFDDDNKISQS